MGKCHIKYVFCLSRKIRRPDNSGLEQALSRTIDEFIPALHLKTFQFEIF